MKKAFFSLFNRSAPAPRAAPYYEVVPVYEAKKASPVASTARTITQTQPERVIPNALPATVREAIDDANFSVRSLACEGNPARVMVQMCGFMPFIFNDDGARAFLVRIFPELSDSELKTAVGRMNIRARASVREALELREHWEEMDSEAHIPWAHRY